MKTPVTPQSATSLPRAPRDEAQTRMRKYFIMMSIRVICFVLMAVITPYGWYTWVLAVGAIFLPYFAVVIANVAASSTDSRAVAPERALPVTPTDLLSPADSTGVIRLQETKAVAPEHPAESPEETS